MTVCAPVSTGTSSCIRCTRGGVGHQGADGQCEGSVLSHYFAQTAFVIPDQHLQADTSVENDNVYMSGVGGCRVIRIPYALLYPESSPIPGANAEAAALW